MSIEQAKAFIEKMKTDKDFNDMIMAIESPGGRLKAINEAGFNCTTKEINEATESRVDALSGGACGLIEPEEQ